jgi:hypothetical protein
MLRVIDGNFTFASRLSSNRGQLSVTVIFTASPVFAVGLSKPFYGTLADPCEATNVAIGDTLVERHVQSNILSLFVDVSFHLCW